MPNKKAYDRAYAIACGLLAAAIIFAGLELTGHIDWPWWLVVAPLWVPPVAIMIIITAYVFLLAMVSIVMDILGRS